MTPRLTAEAQAALDAIRVAWEVRNKIGEHAAALSRDIVQDGKKYEEAVLAALENLDARLKALEGK